MSDSRFFLRQMSLSLVIWGIPAFLFWFLLGSYFQSELQRKVDRQYQELEQNISDFAAETDEFLQRHVASFSKSLFRSDAQRLPDVVGPFSRSFSNGRFAIAVFDASGSVLLSSVPHLNGALERFFKYVRKPGYDDLLLPPGTFSDLKEIMRDPFQVAPRLRNLPDQLVNPQPRFDDLRAFWSWSPEPFRNAAGFLFFADPQGVPLALRLSQTAQSLRRRGIQVGFLGEEGNAFLQEKDLGGLLDSRVLIGDRQVVFGKVKNLPILFSSCMAPTTSRSVLAALFMGYFLFSFMFLRAAYRTQVLKTSTGLSFRTRLVSMYALGYGLPLGISCLLIVLFAMEMREALGNSLRTQAFERLSQIDLLYRNVPIRRRLVLQEFSRATATGRMTAEELSQRLWKMYDRNEVDLMFVISSQSMPLVKRDLSHQGPLREMFKLPFNARIAAFEAFRKEGYCPAQTEFRDLISGDWQGPREETDVAFKLVLQIAFEAMSGFNQLRGFEPPVSSGKSNVLIAGMADAQAAEINKNVRSGLGQIRITDFEYFYADIIPGKTGRADYFVLIGQTTNSLETGYLKDLFAGTRLKDEPFSVHALSQERYYNPSFPDATHQVILRSVGRRIPGAKRDFIVRPAIVDGKPVEILCYKGKNLVEFYLMAIIPQELVGTLLKTHLSHFGLIFCGALLLGFFHTRFLRKHFFLPIHDLTVAMNAIFQKNYAHQISVRSNDEWGELSLELNKAIFHLQEMEVASVIQKELLGPDYSRFQEWEFYARNQMTQAIGGDYYDFIPLGPGKMAVILGDVSGHGISAALVTAMGKAGFSILCPRFPENPVEIFTRMSRIFLDILDRKKMMTCFMAIIDTNKNSMDVANAGQCFPMVLHPNGSVTAIELGSSPLGIMRKLRTVQTTIDPAPVAMVFYSDGFPEALDEEGNQVGYDRFAEILRKALSAHGQDPLSEITTGVRNITGNVPWGDDATAVIIRRRSGTEAKSDVVNGRVEGDRTS